MLPLVPVREPENHGVLQHAGLGHGQHDNDIDMNLEDMLPLQQVFDLDRQDAMLEDGNQQLREHFSVAGNLQSESARNNRTGAVFDNFIVLRVLSHNCMLHVGWRCFAKTCRVLVHSAYAFFKEVGAWSVV